METIQEKELTEGEEIISEYFLDEGIKFLTMKKIPKSKLKGDTKYYREADFYLPKFELYVEFFGQWNVNEEHKQRYREKKRLYASNGIPCVYIYPENLGIIRYIFNRRAREALKQYGSKKNQIRFEWYELDFNTKLDGIVWFLSLVYLCHKFGFLNYVHYFIFDVLVGLAFLTSSIIMIRAVFIQLRKRYKLPNREK